MLLMHLGIVAIFAVLGVVFLRGKGAFLIVGYNTSSAAEKERTDEKKLCRFMGRFMFVLAGCWLIVAASALFDSTALWWTGMALFLAAVLGGAVYASTGGRFQKKD